MSSIPNTSIISLSQCLYPRSNSPDNSLCSSCVDGYISYGAQCLPQCQESLDVLQIVVIYAATFILVLLFFVYIANNYRSACLDIVVSYVQLSMLMVGNNARYIDWMRWSIIPWSVATCNNITPYHLLLINIGLPIILLFNLLCIGCIHWLCVRIIGKDEADVDAEQSREHTDEVETEQAQTSCERLQKMILHYSQFRYYFSCVLLLLLFAYTGVAVTCWNYLYCTDGGKSL